jgi:hypothetical protein
MFLAIALASVFSLIAKTCILDGPEFTISTDGSTASTSENCGMESAYLCRGSPVSVVVAFAYCASIPQVNGRNAAYAVILEEVNGKALDFYSKSKTHHDFSLQTETSVSNVDLSLLIRHSFQGEVGNRHEVFSIGDQNFELKAGRVFKVVIKNGQRPRIIQLNQPTFSLDLKAKSRPIDYVVSDELKRWLRFIYLANGE